MWHELMASAKNISFSHLLFALVCQRIILFQLYFLRCQISCCDGIVWFFIRFEWREKKHKGMNTLRRLAQSLPSAHRRMRKKKYLTRIRFEFWHFFRILNRNPFQHFCLFVVFFVLRFLNKHHESNAKQRKKMRIIQDE